MHNVKIGTVNSYSDHGSIYKFIDDTFTTYKVLDGFSQSTNKNHLIVIKPNWVQESHEYDMDVWEPVITSPVILIELLKYLAEKVAAGTTLCVCDAPHTYADFKSILKRGGFKKQYEELKERNPQLKFMLIDLRREIWKRKEEVVVDRLKNIDDPNGYVKVDLMEHSMFYKHPGEGNYYGADYDSKIVNQHHVDNRHEYLIAGTPITCDLFINLPKMKTHKKTGITCCLKNLVGINGDKNWLPHHTEGSPKKNGDEFPEVTFLNWIESGFKRMGKRIALGLPFLGTWIYRKMRATGKQLLGTSDTVIRNGNWDGNNTCWRMALDLNRALLYANSDGTLRNQGEPKAYLSIVDGIIGGEGNGPLCPEPVLSKVLVSGTNPAEIDAVVAKLMGFDPIKIPIINNAFLPHCWPISKIAMVTITIFDARIGKEIVLHELQPTSQNGYTPHFGWKNIRDVMKRK